MQYSTITPNTFNNFDIILITSSKVKSNNEVSEQESSSKIRIIITSILTDRVLLVKYQYFGSRQINTSSKKKQKNQEAHLVLNQNCL